MIVISYIRSYIGPERFDAAMKAAREKVQSGSPIKRINRVSMLFHEGENKGLTIERAAQLLERSVTYDSGLPEIQEFIKK